MNITDFYIILTGSLVAVSCALLGCFLVLRRMAMVGDAISHAVLPGIVIAYLFSGSRDSLTLLPGAVAVGLFSTFLIEFFHTKGKLQSDASIGVTFTWLFAVGVILLSLFAGQIDLDQECVLYGEIAFVPLDLWITGSGTSLGPRAPYIIGVVLLLIISLIVFAFRQLQLTTFDPSFAAAVGLSTVAWHYILMGMVSMVTVASFELVGAILVVAFLVVPAATAYLLTHNLKQMLWLSALAGILSAVGGYYIALWLDGSIAGAMAGVAGLLFALAFLFSPQEGLVIRHFRHNHNKWEGNGQQRIGNHLDAAPPQIP
ncbi:MAG: metal ABC transporter permease [Bacteroidetes bacterium]|nr:metal ABC transporter permease [Bacteroidota bacterium]